ncbi:MAG: ABC transporter permease [Chloroflexi bacterium]|nr:ABC transporter permease [Chloroflexota bacterium]
MGNFILGRLLQAVLTLFVVSLFIFLLVRLTGDPKQVLLPIEASIEQYAQLEKALGLDDPLPEQYVRWVGKMLVGDFGTSSSRQIAVSQLLRERFPNTLMLAGSGFFLAIAVGLPLGVLSAAHRGRGTDVSARVFAILGQSMPSFWLGIMLLMLFPVRLGVLPAGGKSGWTSIILPAVTLGWFSTASLLRLTRSTMMETLSSDYVKLARIKGLSERTVIWKHAFKNAALPVLTLASLLLFGLITGTIIAETVFAWPGMGSLVLSAVVNRDFVVVQALVIVISAMYIFGNLTVDILYAFLNPRIRYG